MSAVRGRGRERERGRDGERGEGGREIGGREVMIILVLVFTFWTREGKWFGGGS